MSINNCEDHLEEWYNEETFPNLMKSKYPDADKKELSILNVYWRKIQFIAHFAWNSAVEYLSFVLILEIIVMTAYALLESQDDINS